MVRARGILEGSIHRRRQLRLTLALLLLGSLPSRGSAAPGDRPQRGLQPTRAHLRLQRPERSRPARPLRLGHSNLEKTTEFLRDGGWAVRRPALKTSWLLETPGTENLREKGVELAARHLFAPVVPGLVPAVVLEGKGPLNQRSSMQQWVRAPRSDRSILPTMLYRELPVGGVVMHDHSKPLTRAQIRAIDWTSIHAMAVLDYVTGNTDRQAANWFLAPGGTANVGRRGGVPRRGRLPTPPTKLRAICIDHEMCFVDKRAYPSGWKSFWDGLSLIVRYAEAGNSPQLPAKLSRQLARVDVRALRRDLLATGLDRPAIKAAVARLRNVQRKGIAALLDDPPPGLAPDLLPRARKVLAPRMSPRRR